MPILPIAITPLDPNKIPGNTSVSDKEIQKKENADAAALAKKLNEVIAAQNTLEAKVAIIEGTLTTYDLRGIREDLDAVIERVGTGAGTGGGESSPEAPPTPPPEPPPPPAPSTPLLVLTPTSLSFSATSGQGNPASQQVTVSNGNGGSFAGLQRGAINYITGTGWITSAVLASSVLTVQVAIGGLGPGSYSATIPILDAAASNSPQVVSITFTVSAAPPPAGVTPWVTPNNNLPSIVTKNSPATGYTLISSFNIRNRPTGLATIATIPDQGSKGANQTALQNALNAAGSSGGKIILSKGVNYGKPVIPNRGGGSADGWLMLCTATVDTDLPQGTRVTASDHADMFILEGDSPDNERSFSCAAGANKFWLAGALIRMHPSQSHTSTIVDIGSNTVVLAEVPTHIVLDRTHVTADFAQSCQHGVRADGKYVGTVDCLIDEIHSPGFDSQALVAWNSPGPQAHLNTRFEGGAENVMYGGDVPYLGSATGVPSDIFFERCFFTKPLSWKNAGLVIKNLYENKYGRRVLFHACIFDGNWQEDQDGNTINLTSQPVGGGVNSEDVTLDMCIIRNCPLPFSFAGRQAPGGDPAYRFEVINCLGYNLNTGAYDAVQAGFSKVGGDLRGLRVEHNTFYWANNPLDHHMNVFGTNACEALVWKNNIMWNGTYGVKWSTEGKITMDACFTHRSGSPIDYVFDHNAVVGGFNPGNYDNLPGSPTPQNWMGITAVSIGFTNTGSLPAGLALSASSDYRAGGQRQGTTGYALGAPVAEILSRTNGVDV